MLVTVVVYATAILHHLRDVAFTLRRQRRPEDR